MARPDLKRNFEDFNKRLELVGQNLELYKCDEKLFSSIKEMIFEYQDYLRIDIEESIIIIENIEEM